VCVQYSILIALSRQQWLREHASLLQYTYIACLVGLSSKSKSVGRVLNFCRKWEIAR